MTIIQQPNNLDTRPSIQDDLWHIVADPASGTTDFKYVFDVYNGSTQLCRVKGFPDPVTGRGYFNAAPVVRGLITFDWFDPTQTTFPVQPDLGITYRLEYGNEISGVTTLNEASGETTAYNWRPDVFRRRVILGEDYTDVFLSDRTKEANVSLTTDERLMIGYAGDCALLINTYDYSNNLIAGDNITGVTPPNGFVQLNISPEAINAVVPNCINANVKYYDVIVDGTQNTFRVNIICDGEYQVIPLHFINRWGMYDTARFGLVNVLSSEIERKSYEKRGYGFGASSVDYVTNNVYRETKINHAQVAKFSYLLNMDAITDQDYNWLHDLFISPQVYAEIDGYFYPVTIKATNYRYEKLYNTRELKAVELEIELNQNRYGHAR